MSVRVRRSVMTLAGLFWLITFSLAGTGIGGYWGLGTEIDLLCGVLLAAHLAAVLSVAAFVGFFAIGLGPVFWLLIAEIFPLAVRGRAMSLATIANWGFNLIVSVTFLNIVAAVGSSGAFFIYAVLSVAALAFIAAYVPETKGRTLEQIEADMGTTPAEAPAV